MKVNNYFIFYFVIFNILFINGIFGNNLVCEPTVDIHRFNHGVSEIKAAVQQSTSDGHIKTTNTNKVVYDGVNSLMERTNKAISDLAAIKTGGQTTEKCNCDCRCETIVSRVENMMRDIIWPRFFK